MPVATVLLSCAILFGCSSGQGDHSGGDIAWQSDFEAAQKVALAESKPILITFYSDTCGYCRKLEKESFSHPSTVEASKAYVPVRVNGGEDRELASKFQVNAFPSTFVLTPEGTIYGSVPGYVDQYRFKKFLVDAKDYKAITAKASS